MGSDYKDMIQYMEECDALRIRVSELERERDEARETVARLIEALLDIKDLRVDSAFCGRMNPEAAWYRDGLVAAQKKAMRALAAHVGGDE